jgi:hypothetical protein
LENPWTNQRDQKYVNCQREGDTGVQGIGIHINGNLGGSLCQHHPEDEGKDSNAVDGDKRAVERDRNCCQSTRRGEHNRDDNHHMESRLVLFLNANFMPRVCSKEGNSVKNCKECAGEGRSCKKRETGTMQLVKVTTTASPFFIGVVSYPSGKEVSVSLSSALRLWTDQIIDWWICGS